MWVWLGLIESINSFFQRSHNGQFCSQPHNPVVRKIEFEQRETLDRNCEIEQLGDRAFYIKSNVVPLFYCCCPFFNCWNHWIRYSFFQYFVNSAPFHLIGCEGPAPLLTRLRGKRLDANFTDFADPNANKGYHWVIMLDIFFSVLAQKTAITLLPTLLYEEPMQSLDRVLGVWVKRYFPNLFFINLPQLVLPQS